MGKLYNGSFYDAFGSKIGEVEEAEWAGDSFNRNSTIAYACAEPATFTASNCAISKEILDSLTGSYASGSAAHAEGLTSVAKGCASISSKTEELEQKLRDLENMIRSGAKGLTHKHTQIESSFRDSLKTLHYKREVE